MNLEVVWRLSLIPPPVNRLPPQHFHPLVQRGFCPLAVRPPGFAELRSIAGCRYAELVLRQAMAEDHEAAASMEFRSHNQHPMRVERLQASADVVDFCIGG